MCKKFSNFQFSRPAQRIFSWWNLSKQNSHHSLTPISTSKDYSNASLWRPTRVVSWMRLFLCHILLPIHCIPRSWVWALSSFLMSFQRSRIVTSCSFLPSIGPEKGCFSLFVSHLSTLLVGFSAPSKGHFVHHPCIMPVWPYPSWRWKQHVNSPEDQNVKSCVCVFLECYVKELSCFEHSCVEDVNREASCCGYSVSLSFLLYFLCLQTCSFGLLIRYHNQTREKIGSGM